MYWYLEQMSNSKGHIQSATKFPFDEEILMHEVCMTESTQYQWEQAIGVLTAVEQKGSNWAGIFPLKLFWLTSLHINK
jgi:hypothetical protein